MADTYTLLDEEVDSAEYSMGPGEHARTLPQKVVDRRAVKASIATGQDVKALETVFTSPEAEQLFRDSVARQAEIDFHQQKLDLVTEMGKTGEMTPLKADAILSMSREDFISPPSDGELEKRYSENVLKMLYANATNDAYLQAVTENPEKVNAYHDATKDNLATREYMQKLWEDNNTWDAAGGVTGYLWDIGEQFVPVLSAFHKYDKEEYGIMPGANMQSQIETMWSKPFDYRINWIKTKYETISAYNKQDAQDWLHSLMRFSDHDASWESIFTAIDVAATVPLGKAAKAARAGSKAIGKIDPAIEAAYKTQSKIDEITKELRPLEDKLQGGMFARSRDDLMRRDFLRQQLKSLRAELQTKEGLKTTAKELAKTDLDPAKALGNTGHVEESAELQTKQALSEAAGVTPEARRTEDVTKLDRTLLSIYNPGSWLAGSKNLSGEAARRLLEATSNTRATLRRVLDNPNQAVRLTEEAVARGVESAKSKLRGLYVNASDSVMDAKWRVQQQEDTASQTTEVIMTLGDTNALPFKTAEDAAQAADHLYLIPDKAYSVRNDGAGYTIEVSMPIDETDDSVLKAMVTTDNVTPRSIWNTFISYMRSSEDLLSPMSRNNRNVVVPLAQETARLYEQAIAPSLKELTKKQTERLDQIMKVNRDFQKGDERGKWFDSVSEYEQTYYDLFKSWPTEAETQAYMAVREMSDFDWAIRSLSIARDKKIQGLMRIKHTFKIKNSNNFAYTLEDGIEGRTNVVTHEVAFDGKLVDALPENVKSIQPGVFLLKEDGQSGWSLLDGVDRAEVERLVKEEGYRIYQTYHPNDRPFSMVPGGDQNASFVIFKGGLVRNIDVTEQLPYKAGFHVENPPGFYTKIPEFYRDASGRRIYGADTSIMFHASEAQAKKYTKAFDEARKLLQEEKLPELEAFLRANLPHNMEEFLRIMKGRDLNVPAFYTKSGQTTRDASKGHMGHLSSVFNGAIDLNESEFNLSAYVNKKFAQEKNIELPSAVLGSEGKPIFAYRGSRTVSPLATMNRAMHQTIRMAVYDNYQKQAVASFIAEFADPATAGGSVTKRSLDSIKRNPISFLTDPMWETDVLDKSKLAAAKNAHRALVQLLGMPSDLSRNLDWVMNKLLSFTFDKFGDNAVEKVADFAHTKLRDPAKYARSVAFHTKLGLFNPVQLFLQGQSIVHAAAVTGNVGRSYKAGAAASLMRLLSLTDNEEVIKGFAKKAKFFGWNEDDFVEAFKTMREAGIWNVEGDVASLDDMQSAKLFRGKFSSALDKGTVFFKEGERFVRLNAFNTAYLEWKASNPAKKLTAREVGKLLTRYDDLALNMTRKSTAAFQQGIFSLPTQFSTYQIHLFEQVLGKRLTRPERARILTVYSALYGLPAGAAAATLWPWAEDIKQAAMERDIDTNNGAMDWLINGIMANVIELATGKETSIGERYGPGGLTFIRDALSGDKPMIELAFGPSGSATADLIAGIFESAAPVVAAMAAGDPNAGNESYPIIFEDIVNHLRTISSVNNAVKIYQAANFNKFISKNGNIQVDADVWDGVLSGVFGADPRSISDAYAKLKEIKEVKEFKQKQMQKVTQNLVRAGQTERNSEEWNRYMKAAKLDAAAGGLTPEDYQRAVRDAIRGMDSTFVDNMNEAWIRNSPPNLQWKRRTDQIEKDQNK